MKICSLVPSATEILYALGLEDNVVGVTDICDYPPEVRSKRVICRSLFDPAKLTSAEVEARMRAILSGGGSPFLLDVEWLRREQPDLIIAQDLCYRCSPDASEVMRVCDISGVSADVLTLHPTTIAGILDSIASIGRLTGNGERADRVIMLLRDRINIVSERVADAPHRPSIFSIEGVDPLVVGGNWLPEMRVVAGGRDDLFAPGSPARRIDWDVVRAAAPEVLVIALCSSPMARSVREAEWLRRQEGWPDLPAVRDKKAYVVEHVYFSRPGPRIATGIEVLAELLNPQLFSGMIPDGTVRRLPTTAIRIGS
jgi:iron complex transport system substrate-binding protein